MKYFRVKLLIICIIFQIGNGLRLLYHYIPQQIISGKSVKFVCDYDLEDDILYSVKWYKGNQEFYRFVPKEMPSLQFFKMQGVDINMKLSNDREIFFRTSDLTTSGRYRCEISAEAPSFNTVFYSANVEVVELPTSLPEISGVKEIYQAGEILVANCTSRNAYPSVTLFWYINDKEISDKHSLREYINKIDRVGRTDTFLSITIRLRKQHFINGILNLKCTATIGSIYSKSAWKNVYLKDYYTVVLLPSCQTKNAYELNRYAVGHNLGNEILVRRLFSHYALQKFFPE